MMAGMKEKLQHSAVRYLIVGVASLGIDYALLIILYRGLDVALGTAATVSFLIGLAVNFLLSKYWSFESASKGRKQSARQVMLYALLVAFNIAFTDVVLLWLHKIHIGPEIGKLLTTVVITLWNYILYQKVIFKVHTPTDLERSIM